jgi:N-acetylmuramoyl-L-alanine amidase
MRISTEKHFLAFASLLLTVVLLFSATQNLFTEAASVAAMTEEGFTVIIDAGHGGIDAGAIGVNGVLEKDLNLTFAETLAAIFRENGAAVLMTRTEDALVLKEEDMGAPSRKERDLYNRLALAKENPEALFISVHMNSFPAEKYRGFEVYYSENNPQSRLYAQAIQSTVKERHEPYNNRTAKAGDGMYLLSNAECPAILIECGFLSNSSDAAKLSDKDYQKELCFSVFYAIMEVKEK